jgi:hypothetical protein
MCALRKLKPRTGPVCVIFAVTLATKDKDFDEVFAKAFEVLRRDVEAWQDVSRFGLWEGLMPNRDIPELLFEVGAKFRTLVQEQEFWQCQELEKMLENLQRDKHYILCARNPWRRTGHCFSLHEGKVFDQTYPEGQYVSLSGLQRDKVLNVWEVEGATV